MWPWKHKKKKTSKVADLWQFGFFFLCSPDCPKKPRTSFPFYKFFYPIVSAKVSVKTLLEFFQLFHEIFYKLFSLTEWGSFFKLFSTWNVNIQINEAHNISEHICSTVDWNTVKHEHYLSCFISTEKVQKRKGPNPFWSCSISLNLIIGGGCLFHLLN